MTQNATNYPHFKLDATKCHMNATDKMYGE